MVEAYKGRPAAGVRSSPATTTWGISTLLNAKDELIWRFTRSYGAVCEMIQFLEPLEALELQALDKWFYNVAVSRA